MVPRGAGAEPGAPQAQVPGGGAAVHRGAHPAAAQHAVSGPAPQCAGRGGMNRRTNTHSLTHTLQAVYGTALQHAGRGVEPGVTQSQCLRHTFKPPSFKYASML